jgi:hypothetical protein
MKYYFYVFSVFLVFIFIACTESTEPETSFKYTKRTNAYFDIDTTVNQFVVNNPAGFVFLYGVLNQTRINYTLDKTVWVSNSSLAGDEFSKINFSSASSLDSIICSINFPALPLNTYYCTMNLDIPYGKKVYLRNPNDGINTSGLISDLYAETLYENCLVEDHYGSLEAHTFEGKIIAQLGIPVDGYCKCYSVNGDVTVKIPIGSTGNVHIKSASGIVTCTNLNITTIKNTSKEIIGMLGSGNETIYLESTNGNVWLIGF